MPPVEEPWKYKDTFITSIDDIPENAVGFVYKITNIPTNKSYIGKKNLYTFRNIQLGKKELQALKEERKIQGMRGPTPTKKKVIKESDWMSYYGSEKSLLKDIKEDTKSNFRREILEFAFSPKHLTYLETKYQFSLDVLENEEKWYNKNILGKFFPKDLDFS